MPEFVGDTRSDAVIPVKLPLDRCTSFASIRAEGYEVFSVGAIYFYVKLDSSLVDKFAKTDYPGKPATVESSILTFPSPVIQPCGWWTNRLEVMDKASYSYFRSWLNRWIFTRKEERLAFVVDRHCVPILDPIMTAAQVQPRAEALDVFLVSSPTWSIVPDQTAERVGGIAYSEAKSVIQLRQAAPSAAAKDALKVLVDYFKEGS